MFDHLDLEAHVEGRSCLLFLRGKLNGRTAGRLREATRRLFKCGVQRLVLCCQGLRSVDDAGAGAFLFLLRRVQFARKGLAIAAPPAELKRWLGDGGFLSGVRIYADADAALLDTGRR